MTWTYIKNGSDEDFNKNSTRPLNYVLHCLEDNGRVIYGASERWDTEEQAHARAKALVKGGYRVEVYLELGYCANFDEFKT